MSPLIYKVIHLIGVIMLFLSIGGVLALQSNGNPGARKLVSIFHGIGLLLLFVAGFGLISKGGFSFGDGWVIAKMVIWVAAALILVLAKKRILTPGALWAIGLILGAAAAYLGVMKPF